MTLRAADGMTLVPLGVVASPGAVWVWGEAGALRVDTQHLRVTASIGIPGDSVWGFAASDAQAWAVTALGRMVRFDARTAARVASVPSRPLSHPEQPFVLPDALLIDRQNGSAASLDATTGQTRWTVRPGAAVRAATLARGRLWLLASDPLEPHDVLLGLEPGGGRIVRRIALPVADAASLAEAPDASLLVTTGGGTILVVRP